MTFLIGYITGLLVGAVLIPTLVALASAWQDRHKGVR